MSAPTRLYTITDKTSGTKILVEASHPSHALKVVAESQYTVHVTDASEGIDLALAGIQVIRQVKAAPPVVLCTEAATRESVGLAPVGEVAPV